MPSCKTVMIVEDDDAIREALQAVVESEGYQCLTAQNGKEAIALLNSPSCPEPCVILLDLMMPEMNGWQFMQANRGSDAIMAIPVVVMSAVADCAVPPAGYVKLLRKPMDLETIIQSLHDLCDVESRHHILESGGVRDRKRAA